MKILQLTERYLPFHGGVERVIHELSKRLVRDGFHIEIVCEQEKGTAKQEHIDGVKITRVKGLQLIKLKYDIGRISPGMLLSTITNDSDVVHAHSYGFFPTFVSLFTHKPTIITTHSDPTAKIYNLFDLFRNIPVRLCRYVIANTEMEKHHLVNLGVKNEKIIVIPNGITLPPPDVPDLNLSPMIFCLGRLDISHKGQDILLKAMPKILSSIPDVKLVIGGTGKDYHRLLRLTKLLGIEQNVQYLGFIDEQTKNLYMKNCDVFCISPRTESFPLVYFEVMSYGRPIVTTNVGGVPSVVGTSAIVVPSNNPRLLASSLVELLTNNRRADELSQQGLKRVKKFNWDIIAEKYKQLYESLAV